jgi:hypothetical protein
MKTLTSISILNMNRLGIHMHQKVEENTLLFQLGVFALGRHTKVLQPLQTCANASKGDFGRLAPDCSCVIILWF